MNAPGLARSLLPLYAASAVRIGMPLVVLPLMAARLGADEFGRLGAILVWSALLSTLVEGGFLAAATRLAVVADAATRRDLARRVFSARVVLSLPAAAAAFAVAHVLPGVVHPWLDGAAMAVLAAGFGWPATWYLQATQQLHRWARVEAAVYLALIAACVVLAHDVAAYVALQATASALLAVAGWRWLRRDLRTGDDRVVLWSARDVRPGLALGARMLPVSIAAAAYSAALPAAASLSMARAELGLYVLVDRLVRAVMAGADPIYSLVYPRIVARWARSPRAAWAYAARWSAAGVATGLVGYAAAVYGWPLWAPLVFHRDAADTALLRTLMAVLALLWPVAFGWRFFGYWMLGSGRHDTAYRLSMVVAAGVGVAGAAAAGLLGGAFALAWVAVGVELLVVAMGIAGIRLTRLDNRQPN